jgi:hypothetical protein
LETIRECVAADNELYIHDKLLIAMHVAPSPEADASVKIRLAEFLTERLSEVMPPEAMPWCKLETVVEFGDPPRQFSGPPEIGKPS